MSQPVFRKRPKRQYRASRTLANWSTPERIWRAIAQAMPKSAFKWLAIVPLAALIVIGWSFAASAQEEPITPEYVKGLLDMIWVTIAAILVVFMNAGFGMLETGFCRQKNAVNILSKNLIVFALATLAFWAVGFSLMFGGGGIIMGGGGWFLSGEAGAYGLEPFPTGLPVSVFFLFQVAFAGTAATIVSGAVAERIHFVSFLVFSLVLTGLIYPICGHWVWSSNSWLTDAGFIDFAGSTVVHSVGGWSALTGAVILGPRIGKYQDGEPTALPGHNLSLATLGGLILWLGWFGFNPGSELAVTENVPYIALTTNLAAAGGGLAATLTSWTTFGKPDLSMTINGILAGLVAITAGCAGVSYLGAVSIGVVGGIIVVFSVLFFDGIKVDDPVGALSVHLVNGVWGTFAVSLFDVEAGLFYGGGIDQVFAQVLGIMAVGAFASVISGLVWVLLNRTLGIRVSKEEEILGLNVAEHGMEAYTGFVPEEE